MTHKAKKVTIMKIAIIGYGKMGKTIEQLAIANGDEVVLRINRQNADQMHADKLRAADVAIEFSRPESAFENIRRCLQAGLPVVSGTTGWLDKLSKIHRLTLEKEGAFLYASNFSVGVNLFFAINRKLAALMNEQPQYGVQLKEIHHTQKLDAPSGTAISLANDIIAALDRKETWVLEAEEKEDQIPINSERIDQVPGTHHVRYSSAIDDIEIRHTAHSRQGFASGALLAATWLIGKQGVFSMNEVLGIS